MKRAAKSNTALPEAVAAPAAALGLIEWLVSDDCHELDDAGLIAGLGRRLRAAGLPLDRLTLHLRTLHPEIYGRTIAWAPEEPIEIRDRDHGVLSVKLFVGSPLYRVMETRETAVIRLTDPDGPAWTQIDVFRNRHLTEFVMVPLSNSDGPVSAICFCTRNGLGFSPLDMLLLERIQPALRNVCELRTLRQTELTLLDTYIGAGTARRILAGHIRRGQVETMEAALLLCDMRGFTALSNRLPEDRVLAILDAYFDRVIPAITASGGEVLKFMGDAVLAFFHQADAASSCAAALQGAKLALRHLAGFEAPDVVLDSSLALHYGKVSYGNIGSGLRLDFTLIGPDINLLSRIQGQCASTGRQMLASEAFAAHTAGHQFVAAGRHHLKGFDAAVPLYALAPTA
jgi:adenylate cyclase